MFILQITHEENLSIRCYLQVDGLFAELSITVILSQRVGNRAVIDSF